jgi:hypothetical protein
VAVRLLDCARSEKGRQVGYCPPQAEERRLTRCRRLRELSATSKLRRGIVDAFIREWVFGELGLS